MDAETPTKDARPTASFEPSPWADYFLNYVSVDTVIQAKMEEEAKKLEGEVKKKLKQLQTRADKNLEELISFIDTIERLGVAYRLEEDIEQAIQMVYEHFKEAANYHKDQLDLFHASLLFRLLRQHGFYISCEMLFTKFQDENGKFKESLASDVKGMLSLYEASFLRKHEDYLMDDALIFTTAHLKPVVSKSDHPLASQVSHALYQSIHWGMPRLESRIFISFYEKDPSHDKILLHFAKLDFNIVQTLHKKELKDLTRWWKELDLATKMQVSTRDRMVEAYFMAVGMAFEPRHSIGRKILAQWLIMITVIDDIYDAHGTLEELIIFTDALKRWDRSCVSELPNYMQLCYKFMLDIFEEYEGDLAPLGRSQFVKYARDEHIDVCRGYHQEAIWCNKKYMPTLEENLNKASIKSFGPYAIIALGFLVFEEANKEAFEWVNQKPLFIRDAGIIARLSNDIAGHGVEHERVHVSSAVENYMTQHGVKKEEAIRELQKRVDFCRKDLNEMMMRPRILPKPLLTLILNVGRIADVMYYKGEESFTFPDKSMKNNISLILTYPIPII